MNTASLYLKLIG